MLAKILLIGSLRAVTPTTRRQQPSACKTERQPNHFRLSSSTLDDLAKKGATNICMLTVAVPSAAAGKINATAPLRMERVQYWHGRHPSPVSAQTRGLRHPRLESQLPGAPGNRAQAVVERRPCTAYTQWSE